MRSLFRYLFGRRRTGFLDRIEVQNNLHIEARERGKLVTVRDTHNIFLDVGREWLAHLIALANMPPYASFATAADYYQPHRLVRYMCFGIGGNKQSYPKAAFNLPPLNLYGGGIWPPPFTQTDTDPKVFALEAPVVTSMNSLPVPQNGCKWLAQIAKSTFPGGSPGEVKFTRVFLETELSDPPFDIVPLSEIGLFVDDPNASFPLTKPTAPGSMIAYNTFNTISKTNAIAIMVDWTFRF